MTDLWDESYPPEVFGPVAPTGVTAGAPGRFTPSGAPAPADLATLRASGLTPVPATAWTEGQYVVLGDGEAYWDGSDWQDGRVPPPPPPAATGAVAGAPGTWTPAGSVAPATLAAAASVEPDPDDAWAAGQFVELSDSTGSHIYWDGSAWAAGEAPEPDDSGDEPEAPPLASGTRR